jgi:hypothetical protein
MGDAGRGLCVLHDRCGTYESLKGAEKRRLKWLYSDPPGWGCAEFWWLSHIKRHSTVALQITGGLVRKVE